MRIQNLVAFIFLQSLVLAQNESILIDNYINSYAMTGDFSGCIKIVRKGQSKFERCYGLADQSSTIKNDPGTKFMIGSVSKQFTAAAILLLEEEGGLKTTELLPSYFPECNPLDSIRIEHLLTHTSGVPDIYEVPSFEKLSKKKISIEELSKQLLSMDLNFEPGTRYHYSNGGYAVLAHLIEKVSGLSYGEYLDRMLFKPLGMANSGHRIDEIKNLAIGYDPLGYRETKETVHIDPELLKGSGSLYSTLGDLNIWIQSVKNQSFLAQASYDKLLRDYGHNYGFGISVYSSFDQSVFGHDGRINGFIADYLHYREEDVTIIILGNIQTGVADFLRRDIGAILFGDAYKSSAKTELPSEVYHEVIDDITGVYAFGPNLKVFVDWIDDRLRAKANEGGYTELVPLQNGSYFSRILYSYIDFVEDDSGEYNTLIWTNNDGNRFEGNRE